MVHGKVYLVGAGPGHPELLTLKAAELLRSADVIVFDRLIQEEVLGLAKPSAERLYMGKPVGRHDSRQDEIHELLARKAREGKSVVRLKGGDPFLFGRGGEEAEYLAEQGIPFEVVPGVSSALAAPLCAGIAVTHRDASSCVAIVTGHEAKEGEGRLDWRALASMETLVFLMGVKNVGRIASRLMENGRSPETPAAMVQMAFWHDERVAVGTLATIASEVEREAIKPPATLVVGEVVRLRDKLAAQQRDLKRRPDGSSRFEPSPVPDQLFRLALGGLGSQALGFALESGLFESLESLVSAGQLAEAGGFDAEALQEILEALTSMGVIEKKGDSYRNLDLTSRYLLADAPQSLRPALLSLARHSAPWDGLERYLRRGAGEFLPAAGDPCTEATCEALARYAAPAVSDRLSLGELGPVLLVGWGGEAYREAIAKRWPGLGFACRNPFAAAAEAGTAVPGPPQDGLLGTVILSGLMASCDRGQVRSLLEEAARALRPGGLVALHDAFLPVSALPPVEVTLGTLARHVARGGCRAWTVDRLRETLSGLGFPEHKAEILPAGTVLVTASKRA